MCCSPESAESQNRPCGLRTPPLATLCYHSFPNPLLSGAAFPSWCHPPEVPLLAPMSQVHGMRGVWAGGWGCVSAAHGVGLCGGVVIVGALMWPVSLCITPFPVGGGG